ncbi:YciI family protein [Kitasatospora sp. NPDC096204]|uniref:YciI family protein n=1 Tax=Kitasatospora sp. NPDC096204 TaxID=3364094 RepID=UPI0038076964
MKYMLTMHMNPVLWEGLPEDEKQAVYAGHGDFMKLLRESGELVHTQALAEPEKSTTVKVRDGAPALSEGPYLENKEFVCGFYLVDVETRERAIELAGMIPDAKHTGIEVRQVMFEQGLEM